MSPSTKAKFEDLSFPLSPASPSFLRTLSQRRKRGKQPLSHLSPFVSQILLIRPVLCSHHQFGGVPLLWEDIFGLQILQLETFISLEQNTFHFFPPSYNSFHYSFITRDNNRWGDPLCLLHVFIKISENYQGFLNLLAWLPRDVKLGALPLKNVFFL